MTGIAADGHPAGTPGAGGVGRLLPRENVQWLGDRELGERIDLSAGITWYGDILSIEGPLVGMGPRQVFGNPAVGCRQ